MYSDKEKYGNKTSFRTKSATMGSYSGISLWVKVLSEITEALTTYGSHSDKSDFIANLRKKPM